MITNIELAERMIDDIARGVRSGEWSAIKPLAVSSLASAFEAMVNAAYEKGYRQGCIDEDAFWKEQIGKINEDIF